MASVPLRDYLGGVHENGGHISGVLLVPAKAEERGAGFTALVNNGRVLLIPVPTLPASKSALLAQNLGRAQNPSPQSDLISTIPLNSLLIIPPRM